MSLANCHLLNSINILPVFPEKIANFLARTGLRFIAWAHEIAAYFIISPDMDDNKKSSANIWTFIFIWMYFELITFYPYSHKYSIVKLVFLDQVQRNCNRNYL